jgi:hypothetical protein
MKLFVRRTGIILFIILGFTAAVNAQDNKALRGDSTAVNNSKIISYDLPEVLKPGEEYVVTITMLNTGKNKWLRSDGYQLILFDQADNMYQADVWGVKNVSLPYDVNPNEKITFLFKITAPLETGTYKQFGFHRAKYSKLHVCE